MQVEDVEGGSAKLLEEEKDHYLRVVTRGGAVSTADFRGNVEEAQTCARHRSLCETTHKPYDFAT